MRKKLGMRLTCLPIVVTLISGCATLPISSRPAEGAHRPTEKQLAYYSYQKQPFEAKIESTQEKSGYRIQRLYLSPVNPPEGFRPIKVDWYQPSKKGKHPVVLMSPILAGNDLYVKEFARFFSARGMHAFLAYRQKEVFSADRQLEDIETHFHESIIELRQAIDWLETKDSVDATRIGSFAISLGAILTTVLAAVEPRVRCSVLGLPAGYVPEIIMTSEDKAIRKRRRNYLKERGWTKQQALERLREVIVSEPMDFAPVVDPDKTLIIGGLFDRVLGLNRTLDIWKAMGRPPLIILPTGHYTAYFATPYLKMATYSFLKRKLGQET